MSIAAPTLAAAVAASVALASVAATAQVAGQKGIVLPGGVSKPVAAFSSAATAGVHSGWVKGHNSMARLVAGADLAVGGRSRLVAGVEIRLGDGWKTYWRHPGDDGGLPPTFDWSGSRNVKSQRVLYPAPERFKSLNGTSIGYEKAVIFPVEIEPVDPTEPVALSLSLEYGICREICVPAEAKLDLGVPVGMASMPPDLAKSLKAVPRPVDARDTGQILKSTQVSLSGPAPAIVLDVATPGGGKVDLLAEGPRGVDLPVPAMVGAGAQGTTRFRIELKGVEQPAALAGQPLRLTVRRPDGNVELSWVVR